MAMAENGLKLFRFGGQWENAVRFDGVPLGDGKPRAEFTWGEQSVENLSQIGKKGRRVLTEQGRKVANENLERWRQELAEDGKEINSENLTEKYEEAVSDSEYKDGVSGLVKNSIRMKILNLRKKEAKAVKKSEKVARSVPAWRKLQEMTAAWYYSHPYEVDQVKYALGACAVGIVVGLIVVFE
jgi:hypothetical protein